MAVYCFHSLHPVNLHQMSQPGGVRLARSPSSPMKPSPPSTRTASALEITNADMKLSHLWHCAERLRGTTNDDRSHSFTPSLDSSRNTNTAKMAAKNLPAAFNATSQDIEMLLAAQTHIGSKNMQVHMEPYLWKTRQDGINVINIGKTWYVAIIPPATASILENSLFRDMAWRICLLALGAIRHMPRLRD